MFHRQPARSRMFHISGTDVLSRAALNRATLARQMLLRRVRLSPMQAVRRLLGLQAQGPNAPYLALLARIEGFELARLTRLLEQGAVVRVAAMRSTLHLLPACDAGELRALLQPVMSRELNASRGRLLQGLDMDEVVAHGIDVLAREALTHGELGRALCKRWPERDADALAAALRNLLPLTHLPPAGTWDSHAHAKLAVAAFGTPARNEVVALKALVQRYLAAFGPARPADMSTWSGLSGLGPVFDDLRPQLKVLADEHGNELFDLPRAPRPPAGTAAPPRLLGEWDNLLLAHANRTRILSSEARARVFTANGIVRRTALLDGFVAGTWDVERDRLRACLTITLFRRLPRDARGGLTEEAARVLLATAPGRRHEIRIGNG
jgi:hypothetical protein